MGGPPVMFPCYVYLYLKCHLFCRLGEGAGQDLRAAVGSVIVPVKQDGGAVGILEPLLRFEGLSENIRMDHPCMEILAASLIVLKDRSCDPFPSRSADALT